LALGDVILYCQERGPDRSQHDPDGVSSIHCLDCEPKDGKDATRYDGNIRAPETPGGTS
jgi:hypothetical protein